MPRHGKVVAIIPVRKGSVRVKNKSVRPFHDTSLLEHKIKQLLEIKEIDEIVLNTDSEEAIKIGTKYGLKIHIREDYYASSECNNSDFFKHIAENTSDDSKYLVYTPVTSPFIQNNTISAIINKFMENDMYDSVLGGELIKHHMWMNGEPVNYDPNNAPNTQDLPDVIACNYSCAILSRDNQIKNKSLVGKKPFFHILSQYEAIDIDTIFDFEMAELMYKNKFKFPKV